MLRRFLTAFALFFLLILPSSLQADTSFKEVEKKAQAGDRDAQYQLAQMYKAGIGTEKNDTEATRWARAAAELGLAEAQFFLSTQLREEGNTAESNEWLLRAAAQGDPSAMYTLGIFYGKGTASSGLNKDLVKAHLYSSLAAAKDFPMASNMRADLEKKMSADQIKQAKALAAEWKPKEETPADIVLSPPNPTPK